MVRLAILGHPLRFTLSPDLHRAAFESLGIPGESVVLPTPIERLGARIDELTREGFTGCAVTIPLKEAALAHAGRTSAHVQTARSVNTLGFDGAGTWGETTDGAGFLAWNATLGRQPRSERVHILGGGGAARSVALSLAEAGAAVSASVRRPEECAAAWRAIAPIVAWRSRDEESRLGSCTMVVNATPLEDPNAVTPLDRLPPRALVVDLRYQTAPTPWIAEARSRGFAAHDGLGMLVHQARLSLWLWLGRAVPLEPLERAVGLKR